MYIYECTIHARDFISESASSTRVTINIEYRTVRLYCNFIPAMQI